MNVRPLEGGRRLRVADGRRARNAAMTAIAADIHAAVGSGTVVVEGSSFGGGAS